MYMQECPECGKQFENKIGVKVHHSKKHDGTLANPIVECENCGKEKRTTSYRARINEHHFCDAECKGEWQSENHTKEDHPRWNRESYVCEVCGDEYKVPLHKKENTKWCSEECQIQGLANRAARRTGSDHPTWKGGSSAYHGVRRCLAERGWEYIADDYREKVGRECEWCGTRRQSSRALDVHHIVPIRSGGTHDEENLMALCRSCHSKIEKFTKRLFGEVLVDEQDETPILRSIGESSC